MEVAKSVVFKLIFIKRFFFIECIINVYNKLKKILVLYFGGKHFFLSNYLNLRHLQQDPSFNLVSVAWEFVLSENVVLFVSIFVIIRYVIFYFFQLYSIFKADNIIIYIETFESKYFSRHYLLCPVKFNGPLPFISVSSCFSRWTFLGMNYDIDEILGCTSYDEIVTKLSNIYL